MMRAMAISMGLIWAAMAGAVVPERVIVIGVDGLSPAGIAEAKTPNLDALIARGSSTMHARAVMPTSSSSNWASMIMGAGPEQHGITSNDWERDKYEIAPTATGPGGFFPTVFSVLRAQRPDAVTHVFHDWGDFGRLVEDACCTVKEDCDGPTKTIDRMLEQMAKEPPLLSFAHLDHVDHAGHEFGWGTPEYIAAVEEADALIGRVVEAVDTLGWRDSAVVMVVSDHGGKGKGHGGATMEEIEIPWIAAGVGMRSGYTIGNPVNTYDTAATIAYLLELTPPEAWIAKPIIEAIVR